jgi:5-formyltetrahydrofolate cyclo-ligase
VADEKKYLRQLLTETRKALPQSFVEQSSDEVQRRLIASSLYADAATVVLYAAKDNELLTWHLFEHALTSGRRVLFPKIVPNLSALSLIDVRDREELRPGAFGILEPTGSEVMLAALAKRTLICVPGVAFSLSGQRLGRGRGYYDRLIAAIHPQAITAGLAYSFQVLDRLPQSPHDRRLGFIVTPSAIHSIPAEVAGEETRMFQGGTPRCW